MARPSPRSTQALNNTPFTVGVNLPWMTYGCDFGGNAWFPRGGVGRAEVRERGNALFGRFAAAGLTTVRWFLFCDGRAGVRFDEAGCPAGVDDFVFRDMDAALSLASAHRLSVMFVLFDFPWCHRRRVLRGVTIGGHRAAIATGPLRAALLDRVVAPVLARYATEPGIAAWDLFNEPEWVTLGYGGLRMGRPVLPGTVEAFLSAASAAAHEIAAQPVTVGLASTRGLRLVASCNLDLYQVHWYDRRERTAPLARPPVAGLDRPLLLGEFPSAGTVHPVAEVLKVARSSGYCGALAWSATAADRFSDLGALERALGRPAP